MMSDRKGVMCGNYVACLVDVLGQTERLAKWQAIDVGTPEFLAILRQTVGVLLNFRNGFTSTFRLMSETTQTLLCELDNEMRMQYERASHFDVTVERFSDSFLFHCCINNLNADGRIAPLYAILTTASSVMLWSLAAGLPIRGAICIGGGAVLDDGSFYGPALAEAHRLESRLAGYPRIVVADGVLQFLSEGQVYSRDETVNSLIAQLAPVCRSLIFKDTDGVSAVDFLGAGNKDVLHKRVDIDLTRRAYAFARNEFQRFRVQGNAKLTSRYASLCRYLESRLPLWREVDE